MAMKCDRFHGEIRQISWQGLRYKHFSGHEIRRISCPNELRTHGPIFTINEMKVDSFLWAACPAFYSLWLSLSSSGNLTTLDDVRLFLLCFSSAFLIIPPWYFFPVMHKASGFGLMMYLLCSSIIGFPFAKVLLLRYRDVYQPCKPVVLQQTRVPKSLPMGANYVDYEPQGIEVIQVCLQTTPKRGSCNA